MTLEFHKLSQQVDEMGDVLTNQQEEIATKLDLALEIFQAYADEEHLPLIRERVQKAVDLDAGYRGAQVRDEPIGAAYPPAELPPSATIVATDGSQIAPNTHGPALYYLINIGAIIVRHGSGEPPEVFSDPRLFYEQGYLYTEDQGLISMVTVGARRTVSEMQSLSDHAWQCRDEARPLLALTDGPLLLMGMKAEVPDRDALRSRYFLALDQLLKAKAGLAGYVARPRSRYVVSMLHLLNLEPHEISRSALANDGRLEGLTDLPLFAHLLAPAERSALFVQMSPLNKDLRQGAGDSHEIAFFYLNVAAPGEGPRLARIEVPMWVADDRPLLAELQALIYHQCQQVASRYPYILTRSHELAVVGQDEVHQLNAMIQVTLARQGLPAEESDKQAGKTALSGHRTRFEVR